MPNTNSKSVLISLYRGGEILPSHGTQKTMATQHTLSFQSIKYGDLTSSYTPSTLTGLNDHVMKLKPSPPYCSFIFSLEIPVL